MTDQDKHKLISTANSLLDQLTLLGPEYAELREGLTDFVITLSEPQPIINVSENIQQTVNVQEAKNIINNEL
jgi:hypothetical protein